MNLNQRRESNMFKHYIIMSSAFTLGSRIALHYIIKEDKDLSRVEEDIKFIEKNAVNDVHLSSHSLATDSEDWDSVVKKDGFFKHVKVIDDVKEFVKYIDDDKDLKGLDVAKYILSKIPCTHLKLEKLVYLAYADYLEKTNARLFEDKIYAYKLGPVVKSVYSKYKKKKTMLFIEQEDDKTIVDEKRLFMPLRSRIMAAKDGSKKLFSIEDTLKKYGSMNDYDLVKLTHSKESPWREARGFSGFNPKLISDEIIYSYHKNEIIDC